LSDIDIQKSRQATHYCHPLGNGRTKEKIEAMLELTRISPPGEKCGLKVGMQGMFGHVFGMVMVKNESIRHLYLPMTGN